MDEKLGEQLPGLKKSLSPFNPAPELCSAAGNHLRTLGGTIARVENPEVDSS